ncbi:type I polyketide synthase [Frankia sp. CcWB3]
MYADELQHDPDQVIAIVGMAGRLPGADDVNSFWRLLMERGDAIRPVPPQRWDTTAQLDPEKTVQAVGGFLDGVGEFDPTFFGISPREAADIDPQQRLMLETAWRALEDAGQPAEGLRGTRTGVYVGASWHDYEILRKERDAGATQHSDVGNALDVIAARVSYFLKLTGPSLTVETGCSSALVALHLAGQALRGGEIDAALVGGVNLIVAPDVSIGLTHFGGLSPDGRCKAFAASANGFVRGEGVVAVYLKTLARALADGDQVHAVIVATAVNNDGGGESLVTPSPAGQEDLLRRAYADADVPPDALAYVEAHGTGTLRGDPIEAGAIGRVLGQRRDRARGPLGIGSVKTNIGHLEATAGLAGLVKAVLALEHRVVPPSLHAEDLNPDIPFDELNLQVVREPLPLPAQGPVYVGVNSFGWGGTNAHIILCGAPETPACAGAGAAAFVPLSAHDSMTLRQRIVDLRDTLAGHPGDADGPGRLAGIAATLGRRRDHFANRAGFVAGDIEGLRADLARFADDPEAEIAGVVSGRAFPVGRTAFVFPGQGSQWAGMGRDLLAANPAFADVVRRCARALEPHVPWDLVAILSGEAGDEWLSRIDMLQPALWAMSVGLAQLWTEAGVRPDVVVGHSQGEVAAATVAGILSYEDAALVMARRSAIARRTSGHGRMLAVDLDVAGVRAALAGFEEFVSLAVNNGPTSCVLSGDGEAVLTLKELLEADGTFCRLVNVDYASHSPQMDELTDDLLAALAEVRPRAGGTPLMSTVRVAGLRGPEMDARYWVDNLRQPVLFADAMGVLFDEGITHVVEISPHPILAPAVEQLAASRPEPPRALSTLQRDAGTPTDLARAFAHGYVAGLEPFASSPGGSSPGGSATPESPTGTFVPHLPGYPWRRRDYWVDAGRRRAATHGGLEFTLVPAVHEHDTWQGTLELAVDEHPWLRDHQVHDAIVLPGVAMMAMALNAARARHGARPRTLAAVRFRNDLTLPGRQSGESPTTLSALWRDDVTEGGTFTLLSLPTGASGWTEHAVARVHQRPAPVEEVAFPEHLLDLQPATPGAFYEACSARGLRYGPAFQGIRRLWADSDAALAEVYLDDRCRAGARPHGLHPALWDGALQVALALCEGTETVVPTGLDQVVVLQDIDEPCTRLWSYAVRRTPTQIDLHLFDADRRPLMIMRGLALEALGSAETTGSDAERVHRLRFVAEPRARAAGAPGAEPQPGPEGPGSGTWVVCGAPEDGARELVDALTQVGAAVSWLPAPTDTVPEQRTSEQRTSEQRTEWTGRLRAVGELAGVVFVAPRGTAGVDAQRRALPALAAIAAGCLEQPTQPRLAVVTADAQAGRPADRPDPGAALF